jgi:mono/diheme cytochrome c family protein
MKWFDKLFSAIGCVVIFACVTLSGQTSKPQPKPKPQKFTAKQIQAGADIYQQNCSPCHGAHMADPEGAFDLRTFPHDQHARFVESVTNGKNSMPPWGGLLMPEEIEDLWAYVVAGEKPATKDSKPK